MEPINEEVRGATNHFFFLNLSKIWTSSNWAIKKAVPDPIAILNEIKSVKNKDISPRLKKLKKSLLIKSPFVKKAPKVYPSKSV